MRSLPDALRLIAVASLLGCGSRGADRPVVEPIRLDGIDADVLALARRHVASARLEPGNAELRANLALVYEANELWDEGVLAWADALALDPAQPVWRFHESICLVEHGDTAAGNAALRRVVAEAPDLPAARYRLGGILLDADDLPGARGEFEAVIRLVDYAPDPYIGLAEVCMREGDAARAAELAQRALGLDRASRRAHYVLGLAYRSLGRLEEAEAELREGQDSGRRSLSDPLTPRLESYRESYSVLFAEASRLKRLGGQKASIPILERLLKRRPNDVNVLNNLAGSYTDTGRAESAIPLLLKAREVDPEHFATYLNLAGAYLAKGDAAAAAPVADKAVELAPTLGQAYSMRASVAIQTGRFEDAYQDLKSAVGFDASSGFDFGRLGLVSMRLGRLREAVGYYETAARLLPDSLAAQHGLATVYFRVGDKPKALLAFERARKLAPDHPDVRALGVEMGALPR